MKAAWTHGQGLTLRQVPIPRPTRGWALVRVLQAGICGTDLALSRGLYGFEGIPGHEFVGTVAAGPKPWPGQRVVADINVSCGRCRACRQAQPKHCGFRRVLGIRGLDGAFAEYLCVPARNLRAVPRTLDDDGAVFAEPLAAALDARERLGPSDGPVLVVGPGRLGQLVVRVLLAEGFRVSCLGRSPQSLSALPARVERADSFPAAWARRFTAVVECSGAAAGIGSAIEATRARGTLVLKGTCHEPPSIDLSRVVVDELRLLGSRCGNIDTALKWLTARRIDPRCLITGTAPLQQAREALDAASDPNHMKLLLRP